MKLAPLPADKVIKILSKIGFQSVRQRGSHLVMKHPDGRITVIPIHKGEDVGRGLLRKIIREIKLSRGEFLRLVKEV